MLRVIALSLLVGWCWWWGLCVEGVKRSRRSRSLLAGATSRVWASHPFGPYGPFGLMYKRSQWSKNYLFLLSIVQGPLRPQAHYENFRNPGTSIVQEFESSYSDAAMMMVLATLGLVVWAMKLFPYPYLTIPSVGSPNCFGYTVLRQVTHNNTSYPEGNREFEVLSRVTC